MTDAAQTLPKLNGGPAHAPTQLDAIFSQHSSPALHHLATIAHELPWTPSRTKAGIDPALSTLSAVELIGPTGVVKRQHIRAGLLILPASIHYPQHRHAAEELYLILSGRARWGQSFKPPTLVNPESTRHHTSWEWHEMITDDEPLLALWCWTGDIRFDQYEFHHQ